MPYVWPHLLIIFLSVSLFRPSTLFRSSNKAISPLLSQISHVALFYTFFHFAHISHLEAHIDHAILTHALIALMMFCILTFCPWHFSLPNLVDNSHILYRDHLVSRLWKVSSMKARILVSFYTYVTQLGLTQLGLPRWLSGKESTCQCRCRFNPWVGKISWRRKWQSTPVFLPGKSHGQRSLVGYSPWSYKESDTT